MALRWADLDARARRGALWRLAGRIAVAWVVLGAAYAVAPFEPRGDGVGIVRFVVAVVALIGVAAWEVDRTRRARIPELRAVGALGSLVPLLLVVFAGAYLAMSNAVPDAFSERLDHVGAMYFTITTLSTVGFGDVVARSDGARVLVSLQILFDLLLAGAIVRLLAHAARSGLARGDDVDRAEGAGADGSVG